MKKVLLMLVVSLVGCASVSISGPPPKGLGFWQPYNSYAGGGHHKGLDLDVGLGTSVRSIADGYVAYVNKDRMAMTHLMIKHDNGYMSAYAHLGNIYVKRGDTVKRGQLVAETAMTGLAGPSGRPNTYPHLHLEVWKNDGLIDPESIGMTCPWEGGKYWWPVGCER
jgi:murein DD-endopeptidase MepM/ murein hydrolase activator NlpD